MGGNVFKEYLSKKDPEFVSKRLETEDYASALYAVQSILDCIGLKHYPISYVREKPSHGDLDIIVEKSEDISINDVLQILTDKGLKAVRNSDSISFLLLTFQIDLIFIAPNSVLYAQNYFSWNDLGNLIGRLSKQLGFKHGHDGLHYVYREGDRVLAQFIVSNDYFKILEILKLDIEHFKRGFDTYEEMFIWVSRSPYFNPKVFAFEELNHRNRVRDRKRAVYNNFINWMESKEFPDHITVDKQEFGYQCFPNLKLLCENTKAKALRSKLIREKLDITLIMKRTGYSGKLLGGFLTFLKTELTEEYIINTPPKELMDKILSIVPAFQLTIKNSSSE